MGWVLGLTGGIGSGKSAVAERFTARGAQVIDTDRIAHSLTAAGGAAMPALRAAFGEDIVSADGALDRGAMRQRVFADPAERQRLETILHPLIRSEVATQLCRPASADFPYAVLVVPLLVESDAYRDTINRVLVIDCPPALQVTRVMARNGLTSGEVAAILAAQATRAQRLARADDVIVNDQDLTALDAAVAALDIRYRQLAAIRQREGHE